MCFLLQIEVDTQLHTVCIDGYNNIAAFYEPLLEPCRLRLIADFEPNKPIHINLEADEQLNINIHKPFLDLLFNTFDTLAQYEEEAKMKATQRSSQDGNLRSSRTLTNETERPFLLQPFIIKNHLGTKITVITTESQKVQILFPNLPSIFTRSLHFCDFCD
jgi:hypothetical protein